MSLVSLLPMCVGVIPDPPPPSPGQASGNLLRSNTTITIATDARFPGLCMSDTGELMVAYRKSTNHHQDSAATLVARWSTDNGLTWSAESTIYSPGVDPRDVTLTTLADGTIAMTCFHYDDPSTYSTHVQFSTDAGRTFGSPIEVVSATLSRVNACSGPIVEASDGTLLVAIYGDGDADDYQSAVVMSSTDGGATWADVATIASGPGSIGNAYGPESEGGFYEPFLHVLADGTILAAIRHDREKVWFNRSTDDGVTWQTNPTVPGISRGGRPAICQVAETGALVLSDRRDTNQLYTTSWNAGVSWPNSAVTLNSGYRGAYSQMVEMSPGVLGHVWSMEDIGDISTLYFTALYDSNLPDPLEVP